MKTKSPSTGKTHGANTIRIDSDEEVRKLGDLIGVDWVRIPFAEFRAGLKVELEHGTRDPQTDVTKDDPALTAKIALAHLNEFPDYYTRLDRMESEAKAFWSKAK